MAKEKKNIFSKELEKLKELENITNKVRHNIEEVKIITSYILDDNYIVKGIEPHENYFYISIGPISDLLRYNSPYKIYGEVKDYKEWITMLLLVSKKRLKEELKKEKEELEKLLSFSKK